MNYEQIPVPFFLREYIQSFWKLEDHVTDVSPKLFRTMADGCPGLIFQHSDKGTFYQNDKQLPTVFLYGQTTQHNAIRLNGNFSTIGIFFYPNALKTIFGLDANELTNDCVDLNLLTSAKKFLLSEQLLNSTSTAQQIEILSSFLFSQVQSNRKLIDETLQFALTEIMQSKGSISLKKITENASMSERNFERKFKEYVGISPKLFSRICKFQSSLKQLQESNYEKLSDIAFENNFSDQSHFIRTFKEFAGFSPNRFQQQSNTIVDNFTEVIG